MLKLLIDQLMIPVIISPEIEVLCMKEIAPQKKREILSSVGDIIKKIMSREVEIITKIDELYTTNSYTSAQFLLTFFSRVYGSDLYLIILSRAINEVVNMIETIGPEGFSIDPNMVKRDRTKSIKNKLHKAMLK